VRVVGGLVDIRGSEKRMDFAWVSTNFDQTVWNASFHGTTTIQPQKERKTKLPLRSKGITLASGICPSSVHPVPNAMLAFGGVSRISPMQYHSLFN
jgi:hypothetical protein